MTTPPPIPEGITLEALHKRMEEGLDLRAILGKTPVLVFRPKTDEDPSPLYTTPDGGQPLPKIPIGETSVFSTMDEEVARAKSHLKAAVVVPLTPTNRNLHEDRVTAGRAQSNDIRLISTQVSKVHAHFTWIDANRWQIVDEGSSNGTHLNGLRLDPNRPYFLSPSDDILLGDVPVVFLDAEGLGELCDLL